MAPVSPPKRDLPKWSPWPTLGVVLVVFALAEGYYFRQQKHREATRGPVESLERSRHSPDAQGRAGDLVLRDPAGPALTVAAVPNIPGHRPLLGAIVDVASSSGDVSDPVIWWRTVRADPADLLTDYGIRTPQKFRCKDGSPGIRTQGALGVGLTSELCPLGDGTFSLSTTVTSIGDTAMIADEINVGSTPVVVATDGARWDTEHDTPYLAFAEADTAILLESNRMHVSRTFSHFGAETFPSPVLVRYGPGETIKRTLHVVRGDVLHAMSLLPGRARSVEVTFGAGRGGRISLRDDADRELAAGRVPEGEIRQLRIPAGLGTHLVLRNDAGIVTNASVPLPFPGETVRIEAPEPPSSTLELSYLDSSGAPIPVHVLVKGLSGTPDPVFDKMDGHIVAAGRSVYALAGQARLKVSPGKYRVTASHGTAYSLSTKELDVAPGSVLPVSDVLRRVLGEDWLSADFHLHSAPSPDSTVSLDDRVVSLACEGVELAVATDHNHVTDLSPSAHGLGVDSQLGTLIGVEITSASENWGHFNAYPVAMPRGAPEEGVPVYYAKFPAEMFASAHSLGARVVQVNHARMDPRIGYFDLVHLDARTGRADPVFSSDFEAFEAFNGMWIETREKVRQGPTDVVALARRGKRVTVTGNSDSHKLLYEEAGYPRTWVHTSSGPAGTRGERALRTLLAGDTTVSSGPFVEMTVDNHDIGSVISKSPSAAVHVHVRVSAPAWVPIDHVEMWRDDSVFERFAVDSPSADGVRFERNIDVPTEGKDHVLIAWADADRPLPDVVPYDHALSIGFTGPVYIDGDGDGGIKVPPSE